MPSSSTARTRRSAALIVLALLGSLLIAGPAQVEPAAAATPPVDISGAMPRVARAEVTYDFLGKGYDQRLIAESGQLNLYNPPGRGDSTTPIKSVALDLNTPPRAISNDRGGIVFMYSVYNNDTRLSCPGCLDQRAADHGLNAVYLVVLDGHLYISGTKGNSLSSYQNLLYKAPLDLSCAEQACLGGSNVVGLPNNYPSGIISPGGSRAISTTALAGGYSGGNPFLAVGLTDYGVQIYNTNLQQTSGYGGMATPDNAQTPVTAMAWDPAGTGRLAVAVMSYYNQGSFVTVNAQGVADAQSGNTWFFLGNQDQAATPWAVTFSHLPNGSLVAFFGTSGDTDPNRPPGLWLANPFANTSSQASLQMSDAVITLETVPRIDGTTGTDDVAVFTEDTVGTLVRYDQGANSLNFLPLLPSTATKPNQLATADAFRSWFPGCKTGRFSVQNTLAEPVTVTLQTRPEAGYGCWYGPAFADAPGFPSSPVTVQPGQSSPVFTMGGVTAGAQGRCGAADVTGAIRGYLVVTPVSRPADARLVTLNLVENGLTLVVDGTGPEAGQGDQAGGSTTVSAALTPAKGAAFGTWQVTVGGPAAPTAQAAPTIAQARRLTTASRSGTTVYRVDVNPTKWTVPGATAASPQIQAVVPPLQVQGSIDGTTWTTLGSFLPPGALSLTGTTLTTGGGSFFWENPAGQPAYKYLQVLAGNLASKAVVLNGLPAPTPPSPAVSALALIVSKNPSNATANVVPNGLDQAQVQVQISAGTTVLPTTDPTYNTVFYRDEDNNLITNLYQPGEYDQFVGAQPAAGAYPNSGVSTVRRGTRPGVGSGLSYDYVSTNSLAQRNITGWVGAAPNALGVTAPLALNDDALDITPDPGGKAAAGFSLEGCTDFTSGSSCVVAGTGRPALYQAGSDDTGPLLGAHLVYQAQNAVSDLPLEWQAQFGKQWLATSGLTVTNRSTLIKLSNPNGYLPGNSVDLTVVSHGETVAATIPVS